MSVKVGLWSDAVKFPSLPLMKSGYSVTICFIGNIVLIVPVMMPLIVSKTDKFCLFAVPMIDDVLAKFLMPSSDRKAPETFCLTFALRISRSAKLLSKGTLKL